ncbi:MAG: hypothetical protein K1X94_23865 [Sandaracinaceae bacterium]|nr:hypothetical protein [Sandaracinaceae bacterium]
MLVLLLLQRLERLLRQHQGGEVHPEGLYCALIAVALASPLIFYWWWGERAKRRREAALEREHAQALAAPKHLIHHVLCFELAAADAERLASEMDCGPELAHRAALAVTAAIPTISRFVHTASLSQGDAYVEAIAQARASDPRPAQGYRGADASPTRERGELVWHLVVATSDAPTAAPKLDDERLPAWLDALVPVVPANTRASDVRVRELATPTT